MVVRDAIGGKRLQPIGSAFDDHAQWGVCQVGTAATFVKEEDIEEEADQDLALFGAPGCFTWRGNILGQSVGTIRRYDVAVNFDTMRQYSKHGHMGLSVTSGRFFNGKVYYVSGAPHAGDEDRRAGEIYFFRKDSSNNMFQPDESLTLRGDVFGAGFGYTLATMDANGDSSPDLLVGAPFHDGGKSGKGGAVYLYLSEKRSLKGNSHRVKIIGEQLESQFGISLASVGDLNLDGFDDFAVGAPYEAGGGAVYVFFGGPRGLRSFGPSDEFLSAAEVADQVIHATDLVGSIRELPAGLETFGSSLSGGMDMDNNGYPDLVVGAFQSNMVFLLRARPIIDITTFVDESNLKAIDPGKAGCLDDFESQEACFGFKTCFSVDKEVSQRGLLLKFMIEAEPKKPVSRVWLRLKTQGKEKRNKSITDKIRIVNGHREEHCTDIVGYVSTHADLQTPVQFAMSYSLVQDVPRMLYRRGAVMPDINEYPILNQAQAKKKFQATFEKDCGEDEVCQSQLKLTPTLRDKTSTELGKTPGGYYELELGSLDGSELVLDVLVQNEGDPAYEAEMDVHFPSDISYVGLGQGAKLNTPDLKNASWLHFNLGNPFKGISDSGEPNSMQIQLRFNPGKSIKEKLIQFRLSANTSSEQAFDTSTYVNLMIVRRAEVRILGAVFPESVPYGGSVRGESAMRQLSEIGPQLVHKFLVLNGGPSDVDVLTVEIGWPFQVENGKRQGKWLLYLSDHPLLKDGRGDCVLPAGYHANPLNLSIGHDGIAYRHAPDPPSNLVFSKESFDELFQPLQDLKASYNEPHGRGRREIEQTVSPEVIKSGEGQSDKLVLTFDCDRGTAKCLKITCQMYALSAGDSATIEIRSRVWNSTLVEDYSNVDSVEIFAKAKVSVDQAITQGIGDDYVSVRTEAFSDARQMLKSSRPAWWVILISVLVGLLVLVIISLILWKLGFFKRKRPLEEDDSDFMMSAHFEKVRLNGTN